MSIDWEDHGHFAAAPPPSAEGAAAGRDWENPAVFGRGKEFPHSPLVPMPDAASALRWAGEAAWSHTPFCQSLNGRWRFRLAASPEAADDGFESEAYDDRAWTTIDVPGHWELQGHGQPLYTNIQYPFPPRPPRVPAENPTGCYRTEFALPHDWAGRETFLVFEGVESGFHLWVNGQPAGYSQGSRNPAEFRITPLLRPGRNRLAVRVYRWTDATYIEDQDMWWLSGIFREVRLQSVPRLHLRDVAVRAAPDPQGAGATVSMEAELCGLGGSVVAGHFDVTLHDAGGAVVAAGAVAAEASVPVRVALSVPAPRLWSAEDPYLYTLVLGLRGAAGEPVHWASQRIGIRTVRVEGGRLLVNGRSILLRGVNRHEWDPERGRSVTGEQMRRDVLAMKRHNLNAVRTSHYPNHPRWYELCDEFGLYVIDEADQEAHGMQDRLSKDPAWEQAFVDRAQRLVCRDRNHACVIAWSMGNESGYGPNIAAMISETRRLDPTRPINYYHAMTEPSVDWVGMHYPRLDQLEALAAEEPSGRPILLEEYCHAMGNAVGNLQEYWDLIERLPRAIGGFLWQWQDLCIRGLRRDGRVGYAYGGDFGDRPHDGLWCVCGVMAPDGAARPAIEEVKKVFQPAALRLVRSGVAVEIRSKRHFTTLDDLELRWSIAGDGNRLQSGALALPAIPPGGATELELPREARAAGSDPGREFVLTVALVLAQDAPWAPAGHEVAWEQFAVEGPRAWRRSRTGSRPKPATCKRRGAAGAASSLRSGTRAANCSTSRRGSTCGARRSTPTRPFWRPGARQTWTGSPAFRPRPWSSAARRAASA